MPQRAVRSFTLELPTGSLIAPLDERLSAQNRLKLRPAKADDITHRSRGPEPGAVDMDWQNITVLVVAAVVILIVLRRGGG